RWKDIMHMLTISDAASKLLSFLHVQRKFCADLPVNASRGQSVLLFHVGQNEVKANNREGEEERRAKENDVGGEGRGEPKPSLPIAAREYKYQKPNQLVH